MPPRRRGQSANVAVFVDAFMLTRIAEFQGVIYGTLNDHICTEICVQALHKVGQPPYDNVGTPGRKLEGTVLCRKIHLKNTGKTSSLYLLLIIPRSVMATLVSPKLFFPCS